MEKFKYLLLDADETLFDFKRASSTAFRRVCQNFSLPYTQENLERYEGINQGLWGRLERGEIAREFLLTERYRLYFEQLGISGDAAACNACYLQSMAEENFLLPKAEEVCRSLAQVTTLYIVTNAIASVQRGRLARSPLAPYISGVFISEEVGAEKPARAFFDAVRRQLPELTVENALVVGDSLSSDIQGANNAGLPCCWYNPDGKSRPEGLRIDFEIFDLGQLLEIVTEREALAEK